ncbi:MAG TPA: response regulator, partial [Planctomycetaceae bacterium]|nr:response regulator [Planctomycetaceae bacterium]
QMCVQYPDIPIILVTGQGSEETAAEALSRGAVSYVPKSELSEKLAETVEQVLALERADSHYDRLIGCLTEAHYAFELDNDPALIPPLVDLLQQMLMGMRCCDTTTRMHTGVALEEALLNAMLHGNLELSSADARQVRSRLRQGTTYEPVDERRQTPPFDARRVRVRAEIDRELATFVISDDGPGFDVSQVPLDRPSALDSSSGRGLVLMRSFMDQVEFNDQGNVVTLTLRCSASTESAPSAD